MGFVTRGLLIEPSSSQTPGGCIGFIVQETNCLPGLLQSLSWPPQNPLSKFPLCLEHPSVDTQSLLQQPVENLKYINLNAYFIIVNSNSHTHNNFKLHI